MKVDESELKNDPNSSQGGPFIANEIMKENLTFDGKSYKPHITLGRQVFLKNPSEDICKKITPINFKIDKINIIKSERTPNGVKYVKLM